MSGTRRSARITAKASPSLHATPDEPGTTADWSYHDDDGVSEGEDSEHEFMSVQTRKRKAGSARGPPRKRMKGKLSSVLTLMPNEVIGEICSYLRPADLLHLVQSSKIFAIFLLAQASAPIWRYARLNVEDLPECPVDITEQRYACLIFGHYCQGCGKMGSPANKTTLAWQIRRRWCERCRKCAGEEGQDPYLRLDFIHFTDKARELVPKVFLRGSKRWTLFSTLCKRSQFEAITLRLKELESDETALAAFHQSQNDLLVQEQKQIDAIHRWIFDRIDERTDELVAVRNERLTDLKDHLEAQGYARELLDSIDTWTYRSMPTMRQSKRLTDRVWAKQQISILPHVEKAVETLHEQLRKIARNCAADAVRDECVRRLPTTDHLPCNGWPNSLRLSRAIISLLDKWAQDEGFNALLENRKDSSQILTLPSEALTLISEYVTRCTQRVRNHFTNILQRRTDLRPSLSDSEMLDLAIVVFNSVKDSWGRRGLPYRALHRYYDSVLYTDGEVDTENLQATLSFDEVGSILISKIVTLYGLDPTTCTHDELDSHASYVLCEACGDKAMHWESIHRHWALTHHDRGAEASLWRRLDASESAIFHPLWTKSQNYSALARCVLCIHSHSYPIGAQITEHINSTHPDVVRDNPSAAQYREHDRQWYHKDAMQWPLPVTADA